MIAYVFWHRPTADTDIASYEDAQLAFHRSLQRSAPVGMAGSATFRVPSLPWLEGDSYEDWYFVKDFTALGILNEAAVGRGHRTPHDRAARGLGGGAGGLYSLVEGDRVLPAGESGADSPATWVRRPPGSPERRVGELLGDGMDPLNASLWRRLLVLGPAPEYCLDAAEASSGVASTRLPEGWSAVTVARELLYAG